MKHLEKYLIDEFKQLFFEHPGQNHYQLLYDLCKNVDLAFDVGTYKGASAIAMSSAKQVITFDITKLEHPLPDNVKQVISPDFTLHPDLLKANIILIDVDPHDGKQEKYFLKRLIQMNYKGIVVFDDIHLNEPMQKFWAGITFSKKDLTHIGHYSGTGLVYL